MEMRTSKSFIVENKEQRRPFKPKPWTHQDDLKAMIGKKITLVFFSGEARRQRDGVLEAADQFTLKLSGVDGNKSTQTYFKHALFSFEER